MGREGDEEWRRRRRNWRCKEREVGGRRKSGGGEMRRKNKGWKPERRGQIDPQ